MYDLQRESDPLNVFNIYQNKLNGKDPFASPDRSFVTMPDTPTKTKSQKKRKQAIERYNADLKDDSSSIKESISGSFGNSKFSRKMTKTRNETSEDYSNDFDEESIRESIVGSGDTKKLDFHKSYTDTIGGSRRKKSSTIHESIRESIEEDIMEDTLANQDIVESIMSGRGRKPKGVNTLTSYESIKEEISGSVLKYTPRIQESIPEEYDHSGDNYTEDFESGSISKGKFELSDKKIHKEFIDPKPKPKYEPSMIETKEDIQLRRRLEKKYGLDTSNKAENLIFDLVDAKNLYENSSTAIHVVDKFERMMAKYEAGLALSKDYEF